MVNMNLMQKSFQNYLIQQEYFQKKRIKFSVYNDLVPKIKEGMEITMMSVRRKINRNRRLNCFEIFGYDFMIDSNLKVWLIEVNTNPCLEESSPILEELLPRMIDDAFKLTIDKIFPERKDKVKEEQAYQRQSSINPFSPKFQIVNSLKKAKSKEDTDLDEIKPVKKSPFKVEKFSQYSDKENMWDFIRNVGGRKKDNKPFAFHLVPF